MNGTTFSRGIAQRLVLALLLPLALGACAGQATRADAPPAEARAARVPADAVAPDMGAAPASASPLAADAALATESQAMPATDGAAGGGVVQQTPAAADAVADAPTQAEQDFAAIYGTPAEEPYDPVADATLPAPVVLPGGYDPWEKWNRRVHRFNNVVDRRIAKPLAKAYVAVVPRPVRLGVGNFFNNLGQPVTAVNALLQGHPLRAGVTLGRFAVNSTLGLAGIFDPATRMNIPSHSEDFGQTLGVWGWKKSRYVELPLFGPRTVRDTFGLVGDAPLAPLRYVEDDKARVFLQGLQLVDVRTQLMAVDSMREGAADEYALTRDAWMQRRSYQINGDNRRSREEDSGLPDYLRDDTDNPTVPVDVMPIVPGAPTGG